ncbi:hypothetical protein HYFRA_00010735 [Hymenoscyphus fraxineus]|uniref:Uncharacterized protein n=1 Tax=Hymenoscyphus fraxineus TaxID=746836 RepID=A0A9N9L5D1_9HELO|nr:hypothetical protein HYFRA_00010735 [Hymenoscyphus fraxineus]
MHVALATTTGEEKAFSVAEGEPDKACEEARDHQSSAYTRTPNRTWNKHGEKRLRATSRKYPLSPLTSLGAKKPSQLQ